jgi:CxxC-x17-CxxC domain-containing protein
MPTFEDKVLMCNECRKSFIFTAGEQTFFSQKSFKNDPKCCKPCKAKRDGAKGRKVFQETTAICKACEKETTVPFMPTQGRPVLCRTCFQGQRFVSHPSSSGTASLQ